MPLHLLRINHRALRHEAPEPITEMGHWRLYAPCDQADETTCRLFQRIAQLPAAADRKAALAALVKLVQVAASGKPLQVFYDEKQCHELHRFNYCGHERVVWRIRKGDIRIAFLYGQGRIVFLADAFAKRKDRLTRAEQSALERAVSAFIDAELTGALAPFASPRAGTTQQEPES